MKEKYYAVVKLTKPKWEQWEGNFYSIKEARKTFNRLYKNVGREQDFAIVKVTEEKMT